MSSERVTNTTYFYKIRKVMDLPQHVRTRYSPDAWFLGNLGFRAYYIISVWSSSGITLGMYMSHCHSTMGQPVRGRIGLVDLSERKNPSVLLADETRGDAEDWARGVEIEVDLDRHKKYSSHGAYLFRFDVEYA